MRLKRLELAGFKSFAKTTIIEFNSPVTAIVGPNGSGKSNVAEAIRWVLGEQSIKSLRGKKGEDLIWNGSPAAPKHGKASVSLVFDNASRKEGGKKLFPVEFDEVALTRKVFRDGVNEYYVNDSPTRLKDIVDLLSHAGLGTSSHHIISQGEADRILNASPKERREMIEDALGLKIYQLKKSEGERKLLKTEENIAQVKALKKEIQPHLNFLKKQIDKAEEAKSLRGNLYELYFEYLGRENSYLESRAAKVREKKSKPAEEARRLEQSLSRTAHDSRALHAREEIRKIGGELASAERFLGGLREKRNFLERDLGRLEGMIELETKRAETFKEPELIPVHEFRKSLEEIDKNLEDTLYTNDIEEVKNILKRMRAVLKELFSKIRGGGSLPNLADLDELERKSEEVKKSITVLDKEMRETEDRSEGLKKEILYKEKELAGTEKDKINAQIQLNEVKRILQEYEFEEERLLMRSEEFNADMSSAKAILGNFALERTKEDGIRDFPIEDRSAIRTKIERLKIKLEDVGGIGEDTLKEYEEVKNRNEFFEREISDLESSAEELKNLMAELADKINIEFREGILKINEVLGEFFTKMMGGGSAELLVIAPKKRGKHDEDMEMAGEANEGEEKIEEGIDIKVNLPKKRIHSLDMLSGGERALSSIAVLFAISQVNPPPFLVLDETDAALDEANSKKYGEMLRDLSGGTQLVVITHNRETMKQAGILYGVTMGSDSISKLLSIKFVEATEFASRG